MEEAINIKDFKFFEKELKNVPIYLSNLSKRHIENNGYTFNKDKPLFSTNHNNSSKELDEYLVSHSLDLKKSTIEYAVNETNPIKNFHFTRKEIMPLIGVRSRNILPRLLVNINLYTVYNFKNDNSICEFLFTLQKYALEFEIEFEAQESTIKDLLSFDNIDDILSTNGLTKQSISHPTDFMLINCINKGCDLYVEEPLIGTEGYVYLMGDTNYYKIGKSTDTKSRLKTLTTGNPDIKLLHKIKSNDMNKLETYIQKGFYIYKYRNEWFHKHTDILKYFTEKSDMYITMS